MARINFEDDVEAQDEFWRLTEISSLSRDAALGKLLRFFRLSQKAWGYQAPMTLEDLSTRGFKDMIESGWAVPVVGGFHALGAESHFDWYRQKIQNGKKGGRPKAENPVNPANPEKPIANLELSPANPLAPVPVPAPVPAPVQKQNTKNTNINNTEITVCVEIWQETLTFFRVGSQKKAQFDEMNIARLILINGIEKTKLALRGVMFEAKTESFNPADHLNITRLFKPQNFEKFVNLGAMDLARKPNTEELSPDAEYADYAKQFETPAHSEPSRGVPAIDGRTGEPPTVDQDEPLASVQRTNRGIQDA